MKKRIVRIGALVVFAVSVAAFTGTAIADNGHGNGNGNGNPAAGTPAQPAGNPAQPAAAHAATPAKPAHPATPAKPAHPAQAAKPATPSHPSNKSTAQSTRALPNGKTHYGPHDKVTICHATGSATNPYVEITVSHNALQAHLNHKPGGNADIYPVPAGGCPTGSHTAAAAAQQQTQAQSAAGSAQTAPAAAPADGTAAAAPTGQTAATPSGGVLGAQATLAKSAKAKSAGGVLSAFTRLGRVGVRGTLPFTGLPLWIAVLIALGLLAGGVALRARRTHAG